MLSRTDSDGTIPSALRSSGIRATPAAIAALGEPSWIGLPATSTDPQSSGCAPKIALAVSLPTRSQEAGQADDLARACVDVDADRGRADG